MTKKKNNEGNNKKMTVKKKKLGKLAMTDQTIRELETCIEVRKKKKKKKKSATKCERERAAKKPNWKTERDEDEVVFVVFDSRAFSLFLSLRVRFCSHVYIFFSV